MSTLIGQLESRQEQQQQQHLEPNNAAKGQLLFSLFSPLFSFSFLYFDYLCTRAAVCLFVLCVFPVIILPPPPPSSSSSSSTCANHFFHFLVSFFPPNVRERKQKKDIEKGAARVKYWK